MITTVDELVTFITEENGVPDGTEVRRRKDAGVTTTRVFDLETGTEVLYVQEEHGIINGEVVSTTESGISRGN